MDARLDVMPPDLLNPAQRNSLAVGLRAFEMHLRQIDAWLEGWEESGILYHRSLHLSPELRSAAKAHIAAALGQIATLADRFRLAATEDDLAASIAALMSVDWADLTELRSDKLRRYGEVDPRLRDVLDAEVDALAQRAESLFALKRVDQIP